jgi:putative copper resistance protein D
LAGVATPFIGLLAWTGHAGAASGVGGGALHLAADVTHLLAAGVWIGGLVPLVMALAQAGRHEHLLTEAHHVLCRFSNLGVVSVVALLASGMVNTWFLTDRLRGVFGSEYGRLLQTKLVLVLALIGIAAINRLRLLPALSRAGGGAGVRVLRRLQRNVAIEIALGCAVIGVVAVLGITPPAAHQH